jgi:hypothetical protein
MTEQIDLNRLRRLVSFDRLLARLFRDEAPPWVLKGGYALELALAIRSKLAWTNGSSPGSTWTPVLVTWFRRGCPRGATRLRAPSNCVSDRSPRLKACALRDSSM